MSALNQSREGCDWNNCHIMSSFHEEGIIPVVPSLPLLVKMSEPLPKPADREYVANGAVDPSVGCDVCS